MRRAPAGMLAQRPSLASAMQPKAPPQPADQEYIQTLAERFIKLLRALATVSNRRGQARLRRRRQRPVTNSLTTILPPLPAARLCCQQEVLPSQSHKAQVLYSSPCKQRLGERCLPARAPPPAALRPTRQQRTLPQLMWAAARSWILLSKPSHLRTLFFIVFRHDIIKSSNRCDEALAPLPKHADAA